MTKSDRELLIIGASVRSAAESALKAGYRPVCADLFADTDLRQLAATEVVDCYPDDFIHWAGRIYEGHGCLPFVYTGGLENHPQVVDAIADIHQLAGNCGQSLREVRDPFRLTECFGESGIQCPQVTKSVSETLNAAYSWLLKPRKGAAGLGIQHFNGDEPGPHDFLQQFVAGPAISATFVGNGAAARLAGVTLQLVGFRSLSAGRFGWCGSFGPIRLLDELHHQVQVIGTTLVEQFGLRGLFGVDCIVNRNQIVPIEVNPRYTGSVEVLERTGKWQAIETHMAACLDATLPDAERSIPSGRGQVRCGKAVLFAAETVKVEGLHEFPNFVSDRPTDGSIVDRGHPVCTVFGEAGSFDECLSIWESNVNRVNRRLLGRNSGFDSEIRRLWQECRPYVSVD